MDYIPLSDAAIRQIIDASTIYEEFVRVEKRTRDFSGGMYWKRQGAYEYLVKTTPDNRQIRVGPRNAETENTYQKFVERKRNTEDRLRSLRQALTEAERLNKAVKAGRAPTILISVLTALDKAGISRHFTVVGTHALYAYETAAGVRIAQGALATQDIDLLWDARKRVQFFMDMDRLDMSMLRLLQKADPTFERKEGQLETAINAKGFEVDFIRRQPEGDDPHPVRFSKDENDLWPIQALRASVLTSSPKFKHLVISATGRMAMMQTIAPATFVNFKRWMAGQALDRPDPKRRRDARQAAIVQTLLDERLLADDDASGEHDQEMK
ncbi:MAG: hypothetical protein HYS18_08840 [Burkholderiales bacterium]|nr:hypothetical protein [Burkholderiales bacterium]